MTNFHAPGSEHSLHCTIMGHLMYTRVSFAPLSAYSHFEFIKMWTHDNWIVKTKYLSRKRCSTVAAWSICIFQSFQTLFGCCLRLTPSIPNLPCIFTWDNRDRTGKLQLAGSRMPNGIWECHYVLSIFILQPILLQYNYVSYSFFSFFSSDY